MIFSHLFRGPRVTTDIFSPYSLKSDRDDSDRLTHPPVAAQSSQKEIIVSYWFKSLYDPDTRQTILGGEDNDFQLRHNNRDVQLVLYGNTFGEFSFIETPQNKWYNVFVRINLDEGSSGDRQQVWMNGNKLSNSGSDPSGSGSIGLFNGDGTQARLYGQLDNNRYASVGLYEVIMIDGNMSYTFDQFGEDVAGEWLPKKVDIPDYGTNGFHLEFRDRDNLGYSDPNGIVWTVGNFPDLDNKHTLDTPFNNL